MRESFFRNADVLQLYPTASGNWWADPAEMAGIQIDLTGNRWMTMIGLTSGK